jgi:hypothetical protein
MPFGVGNDEYRHDQLYCRDEIATAPSQWRRRSGVADGMKRYGRTYWFRALLDGQAVATS